MITEYFLLYAAINYCGEPDNIEHGRIRVQRMNSIGFALYWKRLITTIVKDDYFQKFLHSEIENFTDIKSYDDLYNVLDTKALMTDRGLQLFERVNSRIDSFSIATYRCDKHYRLVGDKHRRCYYGIWEEKTPVCERKYMWHCSL